MRARHAAPTGLDRAGQKLRLCGVGDALGPAGHALAHQLSARVVDAAAGAQDDQFVGFEGARGADGDIGEGEVEALPGG